MHDFHTSILFIAEGVSRRLALLVSNFLLRGSPCMKKFVLLAAAIVFAVNSLASAADKTWNGVISDSKCAAKHAKAGDADQECVTKCAARCYEYVFRPEGK